MQAKSIRDDHRVFRVRRLTVVAPILLSLSPIILFQLLYCRAYFPITEGWFSVYASLILGGKLPYIDFNLLLPPLYPLQIAGFQELFGKSIVSLRVLGFFVTCGLDVAIFAILSNFFDLWVAAFVASVATIYYQSGNAYIGYDFTQFITLYALAGACFLLVYVRLSTCTRPGESLPVYTRYVLLSGGFFFADAALIKQSNGGFVSVGMGLWLTVFALRIHKVRCALGHLAWFALGAIIPTTIILLWLAANGAILSFFNQVVFDALAAKGGGRAILTGWILGLNSSDHFVSTLFESVELVLGTTLIVLISTFLTKTVHRSISRKYSHIFGSNYVYRLGPGDWTRVSSTIVCALAGALLCGTVLYVYLTQPEWSQGWSRILIAIVVSIYDHLKPSAIVVYALGVMVSTVCMIASPTEIIGKWCLLLSFCAILTIGNGTSAGISEISIFLGLAIILGCLLTWSVPALLPSVIPIGLALVWSAFLIEQKFETPYSWWSIHSPDVRNIRCAPSSGLLKGICVPPENYIRISRLVAAIRANSDSSDEVFIFPHEPIFYLLSDRKPFSGAVVSWFDFISAAQGEALIERLNQQPPRVMVVSRLPESVFVAHETLFNHGNPGIQRQIVSIVDALAKSGRFERIQAEEVDGIPIEVYVRARAWM